jgi:hypothetical protein
VNRRAEAALSRARRNNWLARGAVLPFIGDMNLVDARALVSAALGRMNAAYGETVFNEWVLVSLRADRNAILAYEIGRAHV